MWKRFCLVLSVLSQFGVSKFSPEHVISTVLDKLGLTLAYIDGRYDEINVDCLFGVVLAGAILDDTVDVPGPYREHARLLRRRTQEIYGRAAPLMGKEPNWQYFTRHVVVPALWPKPLRYRLAEFRMAYAVKGRVEALFSARAYENYSEGFSDRCLSSIINSTLELRPKTICRLSRECERFVESPERGSGYVLTHKLLLLQVARARKCKMHPKVLAKVVKKVCASIYTEAVSVEYFLGLAEVFDLFLEQTLLCGYEGYADFLKLHWLEKVLAVQHGNGCFPVAAKTRRRRDTNEWEDGCADHTTGLGAAVLSLYLNYIMKNSETVGLTSDWL